MTEKVKFRTATVAGEYPSIVPQQDQGVGQLTDFFDQIDAASQGYSKLITGNASSEFEQMRQIVEIPSAIVDYKPPAVPSFYRDIAPLIPDYNKGKKGWKSTLDGIVSHYEQLRVEIKGEKARTAKVVGTSPSFIDVRIAQEKIQRLNAALVQIGRELTSLHSYKKDMEAGV